MKIPRFLSLVLALLLQIIPVSRMALANPAVAQTGFAILLRWVAGTGVVLGAVDAVSGASAAISGVQAYQGTSKLGPLSFNPTVPAGATNITLRIIVSNPGLNHEFDFWNCIPLPPNMTMNTNIGGNGFITNIPAMPTVAGVYPVTLLAGNTLWVGSYITTNATVTVQTSGTSPPTITSSPPTAAGTVGTAYGFTCTATGTAPITFTATGLPTGLTISTGGVISGTPTAAGTFNGTITAANGTSPNATQAFSIVISGAPVAPTITSVKIQGNSVILGGTGSANATYHVLSSSNVSLPVASWTSIATNSIDANGAFSFATPLDGGALQSVYLIRLP